MRKIIFLLLTLIVIFCAGCAGIADKEDKAAGSFAVTDARGKELKFSGKPQSIVSLYVYGDEILLGLVDHKRIAGLSKWVHDPGLSMAVQEAADVTKVAENNPEAILALKPDLVLLPDSTKKEQIASLEDLGLKVFVYHSPTRLDNIAATIKEMGNAVGEPQKAEMLINNMQQKLRTVEAKAKQAAPAQRKNALLFLRFGAIGGQGIIFNDLLSAAGIEDCYNRARPQGSEKEGTSRILSKEEVVKANPDYLIMGSWTQGGAYKATDEQLQEIYNDPALATVTAVKKKQAIIIPQSYVNCLSHHAAESVEQLYKAVYEK